MSATIRYYGAPPARAELWKEGQVAAYDAEPTSEDVSPSNLPFDLRRWKEPPHVQLANLPSDANRHLDPAALLAFTRRYGVVSGRHDAGIRVVSIDDVQRFQKYLRDAWEGDEKVFDQMRVDEMGQLRLHPRGAEIAVNDLWTLIRVMFLRDWLDGRAKVCGNPDCPAKYFLAVRKGQKFCGHRCAVLINVRRFREEQRKALKFYRKAKGRKAGRKRKNG